MANNNLSKKVLVKRIAEETGLTQVIVDKVLKAEYEIIPAMLNEIKAEDKKESGKVQLLGFGTYSVTYHPARTTKNPRNIEETVEVPAGYRTTFTPGKKFKEIING
jgi:DNA-binding protein HU-beta